MERDELDRMIDRSLARHAAATEDVAPADGFTEAIMGSIAAEQPTVGPLAGIARATRDLDADSALTGAVMARLGPRRRASSSSWLDGVVPSAPVAIGLAAIAAAVSFWVLVSGQGDLDATVVSSVDTVEVSE